MNIFQMNNVDLKQNSVREQCIQLFQQMRFSDKNEPFGKK